MSKPPPPSQDGYEKFISQLEQAGCKSLFEKLEACKDKTNNNWAACQTEMKEFNSCMIASRKSANATSHQ